MISRFVWFLFRSLSFRSILSMRLDNNNKKQQIANIDTAINMRRTFLMYTNIFYVLNEW